MSFINWNENTTVHVEKIDSQHKTMVDIVNDLHESHSVYSKKRIIEILHSLLEDLKFHFFTEEDYMKKYKFPGYISHKLEHDRFMRNFIDYIVKLESGDKEFDIDFLNSFRNWFINHLELNDKKCAIFVKEKEEECA